MKFGNRNREWALSDVSWNSRFRLLKFIIGTYGVYCVTTWVLSTQRFEQQVAFFGGDAAFGDHAQDGFTLLFRIDRGW